MIKPEDMTFNQKMYLVCSLAMNLAAKHRNKTIMRIFANHGSETIYECSKENGGIDEDLAQFFAIIPMVSRYMCEFTEEDDKFIEEVANESIANSDIDVNKLFKDLEVHISKEDFDKFMNVKKED